MKRLAVGWSSAKRSSRLRSADAVEQNAIVGATVAKTTSKGEVRSPFSPFPAF